jgi:hypothetical protein
VIFVFAVIHFHIRIQIHQVFVQTAAVEILMKYVVAMEMVTITIAFIRVSFEFY